MNFSDVSLDSEDLMYARSTLNDAELDEVVRGRFLRREDFESLYAELKGTRRKLPFGLNLVGLNPGDLSSEDVREIKRELRWMGLWWDKNRKRWVEE